jgi:hypothetical protein
MTEIREAALEKCIMGASTESPCPYPATNGRSSSGR